jgi:hypothetical protein
MLKLEDLAPGLPLSGLEPTFVTRLMAVVPIADGSVQVIYRTPDGTLKDRLLGRADEESISVTTAERPWSFDGDAAAFQLAYKAKRIDLAFLFDPMMAVHTSNVEPPDPDADSDSGSDTPSRGYAPSTLLVSRHGGSSGGHCQDEPRPARQRGDQRALLRPRRKCECHA